MTAAFWDKLKKEDSDKTTEKKASTAVKKTAKDSSTKQVKVDKEKAGLFSSVLKNPIISENAMRQQEKNKYVFEVSRLTNKSEVAKAVQARYGVKVTKVNVVCQKPKARNFRTSRGTMAGIKKAIVTVKQGETIELFKK